MVGVSPNVVALPGTANSAVTVTVNGSGLSSFDAVKLIDAATGATSNCNTSTVSSSIMGSVTMSGSGE